MNQRIRFPRSPDHISHLKDMHDDRLVLSMRFPQKLWRIVNECNTGAIQWNVNGTTILLDYKKFQEEYLASGNSIFKTKNITSFIRQLNLYGFRKVTSHNRDPICNSHNPNVHEFSHDSFRVGRNDLLSMICRKAGGKNKFNYSSNKEKVSTCNFLEKQLKQPKVSRLRMCQLALTKTLQQITREYREKYREDSSDNDNYSNIAISSHESVPLLFGVGIYSAPTDPSNMDWIIANTVPISMSQNSISNHCITCAATALHEHNP